MSVELVMQSPEVVRVPTSAATTSVTKAVDLDNEPNNFSSQPNQTDTKPDAYIPTCKLLITEQLFCARVLIIFLTIFLSVLSVSYSTGQILSITVSNYWCPLKTLDDIRKHSNENNLPKGDTENGCWSAKAYTVNHNALWSTESYDYTVDLTYDSMLKCIAFSMLSFVFIICIGYDIVTLIIDANKYFRKTLGISFYQKQMKKKRQTSSLKANKCTMIKMHINYMYKWYIRQYYVDSGFWCFCAIVREVFEIVLQTQALLLYNGTYLFRNNYENVTLAYEPQYIQLFAVFLFLNCISGGILWILYAFKPLFCHGFIFELLLYFFDAFYDIFYSIFPLIIVLNTSNKNTSVLVALASLQTDSQVSFLATFMPMMFLLIKCWYFGKKSERAMKEYYAKKHVTPITPSTLTAISCQTVSRYSTVNWILSRNKNIPQNSSNSTSSTSTQKDTDLNVVITDALMHYSVFKTVWLRKLIILLISITFIGYGTSVLSIVLFHFNFAINYCNVLVAEQYKLINSFDNNETFTFSETAEKLIDENSELFWWEFCDYKVYPFDLSGNNEVCQCRNFMLDFERDDNIKWNTYELDEYFGLNLVKSCMNMLKNWYMLEKFGLINVKIMGGELPKFNFTKNMFNAKRLKVFQFEETPIFYIDDNILNWQELSYFVLIRSEVSLLPATFKQLVNIEYFEFGRELEILTQFPTQICSFKKLKTLKMEQTAIISIPDCVLNLNKLESVLLAQNLFQNIPIYLFTLPSLREINMEVTEVSINKLMSHNNISTFDEFDAIFSFNDNTNYMFQKSTFCVAYKANNKHALNQSQLFPQSFLAFIQETECCESPCSSTFDSPFCYSYKWQDGICDEICNVPGCFFDGGDCLQLCECDYKLLGDGICNQQCNTTNCQYDNFDCIETHVNSLCNMTYGITHFCQADWVNDLWCDSSCQHIAVCNYDGDDCGKHSCDEGTYCEIYYWLFEFGANSITNDNRIDEKELCDLWPFFQSMNIVQNQTLDDCHVSFALMDINQDGVLKLHEVVQAGAVSFNGFAENKATQLNCSVCVGVDEYWN